MKPAGYFTPAAVSAIAATVIAPRDIGPAYVVGTVVRRAAMRPNVDLPGFIPGTYPQAAPLFPGQQGREVLMLQRRRVKHSTSLEERIAARLSDIPEEAEGLPEGSKERERLMRRAREGDAAFHIQRRESH